MGHDVGFPTAINLSLLNLKGIKRIQDRTEERLTTGLRLNSASDDPVAFFRYHNFRDKAQDFIDLKDGVGQGIRALSTIIDVGESISALIAQIDGLLTGIRDASTNERREFSEQFQEILRQVALLVEDGEYNGVKLLNNTGSKFRVNFGMQSYDQLIVSGINLLQSNPANSNNLSNRLFSVNVFDRKSNVLNGKSGILVSALFNGNHRSFTILGSNNSRLTLAELPIEIMQKTKKRLSEHLARFGVQVDLLNRRLDFNQAIIAKFEGAASQISAADIEEEAALNLVARTRYDLSVQTLSLFNRRYEQILPLFR